MKTYIKYWFSIFMKELRETGANASYAIHR